MSEINHNLNPLDREFTANNNQPIEDKSIIREQEQQNESSREISEITTQLSSATDVKHLPDTSVSSDSANIESTLSQKKIDWHKLAHKLREHNRQLLKKVFKLEQEIIDTTNRLQEQIERSRSTDLLIAQQAEEINHHQEEIARLVGELEKSQQENQSQQILIESLSQQLETSQEQVAQLERECALLQENYNQKTHELLVKGQQTKELHARLHRQQRYTLQYKAALDQYLDISLANTTKESESKTTNPSYRLEPQPIKAWSLTEEQENQESKPKITNLPSSLPKPSNSETSKKQSQESKSPSPAIASDKTDKKPKSLAAVKLPQFPRHHSS
jgi:hypothetical protein